MTFAQARAVSKAGLHVRRAAWPDDQWFMIWRGTWFTFLTGILRPVLATDYTAADLLSTDWTTVPAALKSCPIDPSIGSTGGGDPIPGSPGFPDDSFFYPPTAGTGGGGGGSSTTTPSPLPPLPPADPGTSISVTFSGLEISGLGAGFTLDSLDGKYSLDPVGGGVWKGGFDRGDFSPGGVFDHGFHWSIVATKHADAYWEVTLTGSAVPDGGVFPTGGFAPDALALIGMPVANVTDGSLNVHGGTATVH